MTTAPSPPTATMPTRLHSRSGGTEGPTLLLLHGLACNAEVWVGMLPHIDQHWPGRWIAVDLPGHGRSPSLKSYSYGAIAAAVATIVDHDQPVHVLGHSMGGAIGLALASGWFGIDVVQVVGFGVKAAWSDEERSKMAMQASRPPASFDEREAAAERALRLAGLLGVLDADSAFVSAAVRDAGDHFELAFDPKVNAVGAPPLATMVAATPADVTLAYGEHDAMVSFDDLARLVEQPVRLAGLGHNAHLEAPDVIFGLLEIDRTDRS